MKLKTVEIEGKTYAEVQDGKPVFTDDSGKDVAFDAVHSTATISRLNGEAKGHREAKEAAEAKLKEFAGIEDPAAAIKALNTLKNLDDKKLVDAGEVEKVKAEAIKAVEEKYAPVVEERDGLKKQLHQKTIGDGFARSKFIADKVSVPFDLIEAQFGRNFSLDGGKVIAKDRDGNQIYSKARPGEPADFDEALEILIDAYPNKDSILKGRQHQGTGAPGGGGSGSGGKTISRSEFDSISKTDPARAAKMVTQEGIQVTD